MSIQGVMVKEGDRQEGKSYGLRWVALRHDRLKHWCGYVELPERHPWLKGGEESMCEVRVHGGITWGPGGLPGEKGSERRWVGFDCAHLGDISPGMECEHDFGEATYKRLGFVKSQIIELAIQARQAEKMAKE